MFYPAAYEGLGLPAYIVDLESYEILYINGEGKKLFGDMTGTKCYESLNGTGSVCKNCVSPQHLEAHGPCRAKSRHLAAAGKYVDTYESLIHLPDGTKARLCLVVDVTEEKRIRRENEARERARKDMQYLIDIQSGFIESAKSMMSAASMDGTLLFANPAMADTLGFSQEEILRMGIAQFHPPEIARAFAEQYIPQALAEGAWKGDSLVLKRDGTCLPVRQVVFPIRGETGETIATAAIMEDISKTLELERMNRYQLAIMDSSANYIGVSDLEGKTLYHSPGASRMLGFEPGEIEDWDKRTFHPDWYLERVLSEGIPTAMEKGQWVGRGELIDRHGNYIPIEQTIFPVFDDNRQPMGVATIVQNISEQVLQEKEIEAARRMLRTIIDTAPSAIFWKDRDSRFLGANRQFAHDAGVDDPDQLIGKTDYDLYPKEVAEQYIASDGEIFTTGRELVHKEEPFQGKDDALHWISTSKVLMRDETGEPYALLGIYDDITQIKQNEMKLEGAIKVAEEASRAKSDFLSRMSHEIRTPMNAIKGLAELLALTELTPIQDSYVHNIVKSSNSLLSIINDVLDFSKINENKIELVEGHYLLADLIAEVSNVVSLRAAEKGLMLLMDISPSLPKGLVGDEVRIKQVIINILNNAVKYTPQGHVILRLFGEERPGGFELVCSVEDTGIGIRTEDMPFLFEAFTQADRRINRNIQGTGLGLSISDSLIRSMGGSITVESEHGKGSIFTARFPQRIGSRDPLATVEAPRDKHVLLLERDVRVQCAAHMLDGLGVAYTAVSEEAHLPNMAQGCYTHCIYDDSFSDDSIRRMRGRIPGCVFIALKDMRYAMGQSGLHDAVLFMPLLITELVKVLAMVPGQHEQEASMSKSIDDFALVDTRILVVDDNEINLIVSGEIFRAYRAQVTCAESGQAALDLCAQQRYDLIFMDHMMPEMDGVETTIALREGGGLNQSTPVIALTANVVNDMASYYLKSGMDDVISKPIELDDLRRVLLTWLPGSKITSMELALEPTPAAPSQERGDVMDRLIQSLDAFGMYVSDVMREIGGDYGVYIRRMERIRTELAPLVARLREEVRREDWDAFARGIGQLGLMIHDVGARDCSGRARKLSNAAKEGNADYIRGDFFSLMDNMYMLEKKMEVAVPLALGSIGPDVPFGDLGYCYDRLVDMGPALAGGDYEAATELLDSLAHYSLDHTLDLILVGLGERLAARDFQEASRLLAQAVDHCAQVLGSST